MDTSQTKRRSLSPETLRQAKLNQVRKPGPSLPGNQRALPGNTSSGQLPNPAKPLASANSTASAAAKAANDWEGALTKHPKQAPCAHQGKARAQGTAAFVTSLAKSASGAFSLVPFGAVNSPIETGAETSPSPSPSAKRLKVSNHAALPAKLDLFSLAYAARQMPNLLDLANAALQIPLP